MRTCRDIPRRGRYAPGAGRMSAVAVVALALAAPGCGSDVPPLPAPRAPSADVAAAPTKARKGKIQVRDEDTSHHLRRKGLGAPKSP